MLFSVLPSKAFWNQPRKQRERIASLFGDAGWPQPADYATREAIAELLGLPSKAPPKAVTHLAWAARRDGILHLGLLIQQAAVWLRYLHWTTRKEHYCTHTYIYIYILYNLEKIPSPMKTHPFRTPESGSRWTASILHPFRTPSPPSKLDGPQLFPARPWNQGSERTAC